MKSTILITAAILLASTATFANIANPDLPNSKRTIDTTLRIKLDPNAKEARLVIPRSQVKKLRAELESLENGGQNTAAAVSAEVGPSGTQTIMSGLFFSLAIVVGGMWFVRSKGSSNRASGIAAVAGAFILGGFVAMVYGNAGPPTEARSITGKMFSQAVHIYGFGSGKVKLEVSDSERTPVLIVPNQKADAVPGEE